VRGFISLITDSSTRVKEYEANHRPVTRRSPLQNFSSPWTIVLDIGHILKIMAHSQKTLCPPGVQAGYGPG